MREKADNAASCAPGEAPDVDLEMGQREACAMDETPEGYPQLANFLSSDPNFMQYRGFGYLHSRLLLSLQYGIEELESQLDKLDLWEKQVGDPKKLRSRELDGDVGAGTNTVTLSCGKTRLDVLSELQDKLMVYDEVLLKAKQIAALQRPPERDWSGVKNWVFDNMPLIMQEQEFILRKEDIVTLRAGRESAHFDDLVERALREVDDFLVEKCGCTILQKLFVTPELQKKTSKKLLQYYAPERVNKLVNGIITTTIFVLLVLPVVAMYQVSNSDHDASPVESIAVLIVFTLLFGVAMSGLTRASRQELFAASAAYCAVLVVFVGNFGIQTVTVVKDE